MALGSNHCIYPVDYFLMAYILGLFAFWLALNKRLNNYVELATVKNAVQDAGKSGAMDKSLATPFLDSHRKNAN